MRSSLYRWNQQRTVLTDRTDRVFVREVLELLLLMRVRIKKNVQAHRQEIGRITQGTNRSNVCASDRSKVKFTLNITQ